MLTSDDESKEIFNELEYFEKRRQEFVIDFKKEPPKSSTLCFEVKN